jgi:hypothetical protein
MGNEFKRFTVCAIKKQFDQRLTALITNDTSLNNLAYTDMHYRKKLFSDN